MKKIVAIFSFFLGINSVISQTVISSCATTDSIKKLYIVDADRLALRKIYAQKLADTNNIIISQTHADTVLRALIAVYNATMLAARNAVVSQYNIHTFPNPNINDLYFAADSSLPWMHQLKLGNIPCGNSHIDSLISIYYLTIQNYGLISINVITFTSDSSYNILPLTNLFENISGVSYSEPIPAMGGGDDISAKIYPNHVELTYSKGWGDCPSGCIYRHYWKFNVYYNCSVQFAGEFGATIPPPPPSISASSSVCVNETLTVTISGASSYSLNNVPLSVSQFTLSSPTPTYYFVSAYNGTSLIMSGISVINCNTSINENLNYSSCSVYPNPVVYILNVEFPEGYRDIYEKNEIKIVDVFGKIILNEELKVGNFGIQIDVSEFPKGMYYLKVGNEIRKIVKE